MTSTFMLLSHSIVLACDREAFETLLTGLHDAVRPDGPLEQFAFERLVNAAWNVRRAQSAESSLLAKSQGEDPLLHPDTAADARRFSTLVRQWESSYKRAQKELADLQTSRAFRNPAADPPPLAHRDQLSRLAKQTQSRKSHEVDLQMKMLDAEAQQLFNNHLADLGPIAPVLRNKPNRAIAKQSQSTLSATARTIAKQSQSAPAAAQVQCCEHSAEQTQSPEPAHPQPFVRAPKVGRNEPCPCGSGLKFKRCCGNPASVTSAAA